MQHAKLQQNFTFDLKQPSTGVNGYYTHPIRYSPTDICISIAIQSGRAYTKTVSIYKTAFQPPHHPCDQLVCPLDECSSLWKESPLQNLRVCLACSGLLFKCIGQDLAENTISAAVLSIVLGTSHGKMAPTMQSAQTMTGVDVVLKCTVTF